MEAIELGFDTLVRLCIPVSYTHLTLVGARPDLAVTFVDNHDTQPGQSLESWVDGWFKAAAYGDVYKRQGGTVRTYWR